MFTLRLLKIKIHSRRVFMFKRCLPIFAFLLASLMIIWPAFVKEKDKFSVAVPSLNQTSGNGVDMEDVKFFSKDRRDNPLTVVAKTVQEIDSAKKVLKLNTPKATYTTADNIVLTSVSPFALAFQNEKYLYFEKDILTTSDTGYEALSQKVTYDYDTNTITSDSPVFVKGTAGMLKSEGVIVTNKGEHINFKGKTKTLMFETEKKVSQVKDFSFDKQDEYFKKNKNHTLITSENGLIINQAQNTITALKNAHIYQKKENIKAEKLILTYKKDAYNNNQIVKAEGYKNVQALQEGKTIKAEEMILYKDKTEALRVLNPLKSYKKVQLKNEVEEVAYLNDKAMFKEGNHLVYADSMYVIYKKGKQTTNEIDMVVAIGNVQASNGVQRILGNYGIYNPKTNVVDLYDNVQLHQGNSVLKGQWANLNLQSGISSLKSQQDGATKTRVKGSLIPTDFEQEGEEK